MKKKIWYVSKYANIAKYGADTRQSNFCAEFAKQGNNVRLITSNSSHLYKELPKFSGLYLDTKYSDFSVTWVNTFQYKNHSGVRRILSWLHFEISVIFISMRKKYEKPDIFIASSLSLLSVLSAIFYKKFFNSKFIFEIRDIWPKTLVDIGDFSNSNVLVWILRYIEHLGYRHSDLIVGTMPGLHLHVEKEVGLGSKVIHIPQGVDLDFYLNHQKDLSDDFIKKYIPKDRFLVTYTGSCGPANALDNIVDAASILMEKYNNSRIHFLIVGEGNSKEDLMLRASSLKNITFAPSVNKNQVQHILSLSDLLVCPVRNDPVYEYGMSPNKFIDYMMAKKPIICLFSGLHSMLNEAECGEFIPSGDIEGLINSINKYKRMNQAERNKIGLNGYNFLVEKQNYAILSKRFFKSLY